MEDNQLVRMRDKLLFRTLPFTSREKEVISPKDCKFMRQVVDGVLFKLAMTEGYL